jgi:hypothetical protein
MPKIARPVAFFDLDVEQMWQTATLSVPALSLAAQEILDGAD